MHTHQHAAADHSPRMELRKILLVEAARFQQHHRQGVAEREHHCGARCRRKVQRTRFLLNVDIEKQMRVLRER